MLFYGPPGTGKTTTITNLINKYQEDNNEKNKGLMIHLNAIDERGIEIIRTQISNFVNSKSLFGTGTKFVIFDEVDYMTKNAQQALRYLLQDYSNSVRFCLIGNYISRIDEALQNEFVRLKFNQLPKSEIYKFLRNISEKEKLNLSDNIIGYIQELYGSDIRSMINYIQTNHNTLNNFKVINNDVWETLLKMINKGNNMNNILEYIEELSYEYNIDKINLLKRLINYIIRNKDINSELLTSFEHSVHNNDNNINYFVKYVTFKILEHGIL